ncbi:MULTISPECIES: alanine racemase [Gammaproteobacteria]|uniref:alanine racemase n=1 Tax=Gammaproteobacteria TaxID=1236 RepID=UPI000DD009DD|nr:MULTISPECIES: alanine racemase [Gammaproteobacteria]RTE87663.1 alanine racemase [Aliidiomarina sp. B3213]TCZ92553.1 alanine racemase [Lysobacter sp. N42]
MRPARAYINLAALRNNLQEIRRVAPGKHILAVLKANAYGHGLTRIAKTLDDVDALGVARLNEGMELRKDGITKPIVLLEGFFSEDQLPLLAASNLQPVLHHQWQLDALYAAKNLPASLKVWLKVDSGMHRLGIEPSQAKLHFEQLSACEWVVGEPILMSHFACADEPKHPQNAEQLEIFKGLVNELRPTGTSLSNSAAIFAGLGNNTDWIRPGLAMYGICPFVNQVDTDSYTSNLKPVMNLLADVISTKRIHEGDFVGYGATWQASKSTNIGIVSIGYGDGYPRHAPVGTPVWINGKRYPLIGRVAMDMITVDLGDDNVEPGATAELWGDHLPVKEVAEHVGTIAYELLCNVAKRVWLEYSE